MKRMMDCRSGKVNLVEKSLKTVNLSLNESDLNTVFTNDEGYIYKLSDIVSNKLIVLYISEIKSLKDYQYLTYDIVVVAPSSTAVQGNNQYRDISNFFLNNGYSNKESAVIFVITMPK
jgi:hypothetical protein